MNFELVKCMSKSKKTIESMHHALQGDLERVAQLLLCEYDMYDRSTKTAIDVQTLHNNLLKMFQFKQECAFCCAITKTGSRCTRKQYNNTSYCKIHAYKEYLESLAKISPVEQVTLIQNTPSLESVPDTVDKKFIDGTFYYVDDKYVYDVSTKQKVGYVEYLGDEPKYILTDDPFILDESL